MILLLPSVHPPIRMSIHLGIAHLLYTYHTTHPVCMFVYIPEALI